MQTNGGIQVQRYLEQARRDYEGKPDATATLTDQYGESIVLVRMRHNDGRAYVLAWLGAEHAESPDEYDADDLPDDWRVTWQKLHRKRTRKPK